VGRAGVGEEQWRLACGQCLVGHTEFSPLRGALGLGLRVSAQASLPEEHCMGETDEEGSPWCEGKEGMQSEPVGPSWTRGLSIAPCLGKHG
jgi:hypothetical protein